MLAPPSGMIPDSRKITIAKKLKRYAKNVLEMEKKLGVDPNESDE